MLRVSYSSKEAKEALKTAIPAMESGLNINTSQGDISLFGDDAKQVMELVAKIAEKRSKHQPRPCQDALDNLDFG